ncbi:MAG: non-hydrolyzing UDP-N-acetylglucosamine 2-epimerase [bacterium]
MNITDRYRIQVVAGARPNFMKVAPLVRELKSRSEIEVSLVHTGQHYDQGMSADFFADLGIPEPDINLEVGSGSHAQQTAKIISSFEPVLMKFNPQVVVVVGDVNSTIACALVAVKLGIEVAHVEAGLRSFDRDMPEEINRIMTDSIAHYLFTTEPEANKNLLAEGIPDSKIFLVGNIMIDTLVANLSKSDAVPIIEELGFKEYSSRFGLLTLHRPSNVDDKKTLERIFDALREIASLLPIVFPVHPRTKARLDEFGLSGQLTTENGFWCCRPLGYLETLHLCKRSTMVLTDSGGIQEETTYLGIPCLTIRENTERLITVTRGTNTLVGRNPQRILTYANQILMGGGKKGKIPDKWNGRTARRIVDILINSLDKQ